MAAPPTVVELLKQAIDDLSTVSCDVKVDHSDGVRRTHATRLYHKERVGVRGYI